MTDAECVPIGAVVEVREVPDNILFFHTHTASGKLEDGNRERFSVSSRIPDGSIVVTFREKRYMVLMEDVLQTVLEHVGPLEVNDGGQ